MRRTPGSVKRTIESFRPPVYSPHTSCQHEKAAKTVTYKVVLLFALRAFGKRLTYFKDCDSEGICPQRYLIYVRATGQFTYVRVEFWSWW